MCAHFEVFLPVFALTTECRAKSCEQVLWCDVMCYHISLLVIVLISLVWFCCFYVFVSCFFFIPLFASLLLIVNIIGVVVVVVIVMLAFRFHVCEMIIATWFVYNRQGFNIMKYCIHSNEQRAFFSYVHGVMVHGAYIWVYLLAFFAVYCYTLFRCYQR